MTHCIIIRGPAGIGKTVVSKKLAKKINAKYFSFDEVMEINKLDDIVGDGIPSENFIKANKIILNLIKDYNIVVLDGCFYRKEQIKHILENLKKVHIFTLNADICECLKRNQNRKNSLINKDVKQVYDLVSKIRIGKYIETKGKNIKEIIDEIIHHINFLTSFSISAQEGHKITSNLNFLKS